MFYCRVIALQGAYIAADWWLALWAYSPPSDQGNPRYLWVYGMLTGIVVVVSLLRSGMFFEATLRASTRIHNAMAARVLRAPLAFFHTNPAGRILNRFSKDMGSMDDMLPLALFDVCQVR